MPIDDKPGVGTKVEENEEQNQEFEEEVHNETDDEEELYDKDGKPLPWNKSKRFRKLYGEAKDGRRIVSQLKEMGLTVKDLPRLADDLARLAEFDAGYAQYLKEKRSGRTSDSDDETADAASREAEALRARLKRLGVKMQDDPDEEDERQSEREALRTVAAARDLMVEALEASEGFDALENDEKRERLAELDFKVGRKLKNNPEMAKAFRGGSLAVIKKIIKEILGGGSEDKGAPKPRKPSPDNKPFVKRTAPRVDSSGNRSSFQNRKPAGDPKNIKEASESMLVDLRAAKAARAAEE